VQRALQVVGQEHAEQARPGQQRGDERAAPVALEDDAQRQQRVRTAGFDSHERRQQHDGHDKKGQGDNGAPPVVFCFGEAVDQAGQAQGDGDRARDVVVDGALGAALAHQAHRARRGDKRDRDVDQQAPAPGGVLRQHPPSISPIAAPPPEMPP
jgi:hypothetical protein